MAAGDEDAEMERVENCTDVTTVLITLDPIYWYECSDKQLEATGYTIWTTGEPARLAAMQARMNYLLELGLTDKAFFVVPAAVRLWRESRDANMDDTGRENEDAELAFLIFLSERRERARLFNLVTANG